MSDEKKPSQFPDLKEIGNMASKLFCDLKKSIGEIAEQYQAKRKPDEPKVKPTAKTESAQPKQQATEQPSENKQKKDPEPPK